VSIGAKGGKSVKQFNTVDAEVRDDRFVEELRGMAIELHQRLVVYAKGPLPTGWKPSTTPRGLVSQIENMTAALMERLQKTESALGWVLSPFVNDSTPEVELRKRIKFANEDWNRI
jgi:hypothetical protein